MLQQLSNLWKMFANSGLMTEIRTKIEFISENLRFFVTIWIFSSDYNGSVASIYIVSWWIMKQMVFRVGCRRRRLVNVLIPNLCVFILCLSSIWVLVYCQIFTEFSRITFQYFQKLSLVLVGTEMHDVEARVAESLFSDGFGETTINLLCNLRNFSS